MALTLQAKLALDDSPFRSGLRAAKGLAASFGNELKKFITSPLTALAGVAAGALTFQGLKDGVNNIFEAGASLENLHRVTGASTEALARLTPVFKAAELGSEDLSAALNRTQNALYKAKDGTGGKVFEELRLDFRKLIGESPDQAFIDIGRAIAGLATQAERTGAAMKIFGRSGALLLPVFEQIANGDFGGMSEKAKLMADNAKEFRAVTVEMRKASAVLDQFYIGAAIALAPIIKEFSGLLQAQAPLILGAGLAFGATIDKAVGLLLDGMDTILGVFADPARLLMPLDLYLQSVAASFMNSLTNLALGGGNTDFFGAQALRDVAKVASADIAGLMKAGKALRESFFPRRAGKEEKDIPESLYGLGKKKGFQFAEGNEPLRGGRLSASQWDALTSPGGSSHISASSLLTSMHGTSNWRERRAIADAAVLATGERASTAVGGYNAIRFGDAKRRKEYERNKAMEKTGVEKSNEFLQRIDKQTGGMLSKFMEWDGN